jgi:hypothetical protein
MQGSVDSTALDQDEAIKQLSTPPLVYVDYEQILTYSY